jgi:hypothetical protein
VHDPPAHVRVLSNDRVPPAGPVAVPFLTQVPPEQLPERCQVVVPPRGPVTLPLEFQERLRASASAASAVVSDMVQAAIMIALCIGLISRPWMCPRERRLWSVLCLRLSTAHQFLAFTFSRVTVCNSGHFALLWAHLRLYRAP